MSDWKPTHPLALPNSSGAKGMRAGDKIACKLDGRLGVVDEFLPDGGTFVAWDDGTFGEINWTHLRGC